MTAKIYCIECLETGEKYIGSTKKKYLSQRISHHRYDKIFCVSRHIIERGNWKYYLLEEVDESQRYIREQYYMDITDKCINKQRAIGFDEKKYHIERRKYRYSWGGDPRASNNLLLIDPSLFCV